MLRDSEGFTALAESHDNPFLGDERLPVVFSMEPLKDEAASAEAGRPIYRDVEFIRIHVPGDKDNIIFQPVDETHRRRFAQRYAHWKRTGQGEVVQGTPLAAWPAIERAQVKELEHFNCRTVEQLAELSDVLSQRFPGIQALKQKARDFLKASEGSAHVTQLRAELERQQAELAAMKQQLDAALKAGAKRQAKEVA